MKLFGRMVVERMKAHAYIYTHCQGVGFPHQNSLKTPIEDTWGIYWCYLHQGEGKKRNQRSIRMSTIFTTHPPPQSSSQEHPSWRVRHHSHGLPLPPSMRFRPTRVTCWRALFRLGSSSWVMPNWPASEAGFVVHQE